MNAKVLAYRFDSERASKDEAAVGVRVASTRTTKSYIVSILLGRPVGH